MNQSGPAINVRVSALFACHFFGIGLFLPFFPVVLELRGLNAQQIGLVLGTGIFLQICANPLLTNISDRTGHRRYSILAYALLAAVFMALFSAAAGFLFLAAAAIAYMVFKAPVLPLSDAYALDVSRNTGADYARMRLWGSAGFVAANLIGGNLATETGSWLMLVLIAVSCMATGAVVLSLPRQRRRKKGHEEPADTGGNTPFRTIWFWPVLVLLGLFQATHSAFYGFGTLYWQANGVADMAIGWLWAIGVIAEIALFTIAGKLANRFDPSLFLIAAGIAAIIRWGLFPLADTFLSMAALQILHGLTFGAAHLGAVAILAKVVPSRWAGTGQGLLSTSIGIQMSIGLSVSGWLYAADVNAPFYAMSMISVVGTLAMIALTPMVRQRMAETAAEGNA
ncbi:MFS transporter [Roseibium denhamense]|uniref:MFS transporter, PPP family, 3-phenylpropionic acid transporter n=1 Tax=Roseibium denhamense TaxID=76305 RepID=A0ABY1N8M7_9HYPH|nr:MFS transporter [Roseibium denhamense]MTI05633.1 MFS transporter [Roseibium denhamense]SMP03376.1 MFS transporter, PPP family, 3-phenylpropionic acid transporter [Roseibium denhamense]